MIKTRGLTLANPSASFPIGNVATFASLSKSGIIGKVILAFSISIIEFFEINVSGLLLSLRSRIISPRLPMMENSIRLSTITSPFPAASPHSIVDSKNCVAPFVTVTLMQLSKISNLM